MNPNMIAAGNAVNPHAFVLFLADTTSKGLFILAAATLVALALRNRSAAARHLVWTVAIVSVLALAPLAYVLPGWQVPVIPAALQDAIETPGLAPEAPPPRVVGRVADPSERAQGYPSAGARRDTLVPPGHPDSLHERPTGAASLPSANSAPSRPTDWTLLLFYAWIAGLLAVLAPYAFSTVRAIRMIRQAQLFPESLRARATASIPVLAGNRRLRLFLSERAEVPMTWGLIRPVVVLPIEAANWPDDCLRMVLVHEASHIRRLDCLWQFLAQATSALYWFNPLVWIAARRLRIERERACDDHVLSAGLRPSEYAESLLNIARSLRSTLFAPAGAVAMARRSQLEGRLLAILDASRNRCGLTARMLLAGLAVAACATISLAVLKLGYAQMPNNQSTAFPSSRPSLDAGAPRPTTPGPSATALSFFEVLRDGDVNLLAARILPPPWARNRELRPAPWSLLWIPKEYPNLCEEFREEFGSDLTSLKPIDARTSGDFSAVSFPFPRNPKEILVVAMHRDSNVWFVFLMDSMSKSRTIDEMLRGAIRLWNEPPANMKDLPARASVSSPAGGIAVACETAGRFLNAIWDGDRVAAYELLFKPTGWEKRQSLDHPAVEVWSQWFAEHVRKVREAFENDRANILPSEKSAVRGDYAVVCVPIPAEAGWELRIGLRRDGEQWGVLHINDYRLDDPIVKTFDAIAKSYDNMMQKARLAQATPSASSLDSFTPQFAAIVLLKAFWDGDFAKMEEMLILPQWAAQRGPALSGTPMIGLWDPELRAETRKKIREEYKNDFQPMTRPLQTLTAGEFALVSFDMPAQPNMDAFVILVKADNRWRVFYVDDKPKDGPGLQRRLVEAIRLWDGPKRGGSISSESATTSSPAATIGNARRTTERFAAPPAAASNVARTMIANLKTALDMYEVDLGRYPDRLESLIWAPDDEEARKNWKGPYIRGASIPNDPWGKPLEYKTGADQKPFELRSVGPDGQFGTPDDIRLP
jgi:type II secretion system protein G